MVYYKEHGISISGICYIHLPYGPVPKNYDMLFGIMASDSIAHIEVAFENGYEKHKVVADKQFNKDSLSELEISVLNRVYEKFKDFSSSEISTYSHNEKGYRCTGQGEIISYHFAKEIDIN